MILVNFHQQEKPLNHHNSKAFLLAVFSHADMNKINCQQVKKEGKYTFKMKIIENTTANINASVKAVK